MPEIFISPPKSLVEPKSAVFFVTSGKFKPPNSNMSIKFVSHSTESIFNNNVLDALVTSVLKLFPSVNFQTRKVSIVPKKYLFGSILCSFNNQRALDAEK